MRITLNKTKTFIPSFLDNKKQKKEEQFKITYRVMNALDFEYLVDNKISDIEMFKRQVESIDNLVINNEEITKDSIIDIPNSWELIQETVKEILKNSHLSDNEKN